MVGGGRRRAGGQPGEGEGESLLPLFLSRLGSHWPQTLHRLLAAEPEILARAAGAGGGGGARASQALSPQENRVGAWGEEALQTLLGSARTQQAGVLGPASFLKTHVGV